MQAASLIITISYVIGVISLITHNAISKDKDEGFYYILMYFVFAAVGSMMISFRTVLSPFLSIVVANSIVVLGYISLLVGLRKIYSHKNYRFFYFAYLFSFVLFFVIFLYIFPLTIVRVAIFNVYVIITLLFSLYSLLIKDEGKSVNEVMSLSIILVLFFVTLRLFLNIVFQESATEFIQYERDPLFIVFIGISNIFLISGYFSIQNDLKSIELVKKEEFQSNLLSNLSGFVYVIDVTNEFVVEFLSEGFYPITGYQVNDFLKNQQIHLHDLLNIKEKKDVIQKVDNSIHNHQTSEYNMKRIDGNEIWVLDKYVIHFKNNQVSRIEGFVTDITSIKQMESKLEHLSFHDQLTGLYNRRFFEEEMSRLDTSRNVPISIILADLNALKLYNDSLGHITGDEVLKLAGKALKDACRDDDIITRWGGDEFAIILPKTTYKQSLIIMERIYNQTKEQNKTHLPISLSMGASTKISKDIKLESVFNHAEKRMYQNKRINQDDNRIEIVKTIFKELEKKNPKIVEHSKRVSRFAKQISKQMNLSNEQQDEIEIMGLYHDIGYISIDERLLSTTKTFEHDELEMIKPHSKVSSRILSAVPKYSNIIKGVLYHHERIDGMGYPNHLTGTDIPLESKILAVADAYDAMVNHREYKPKLSHSEAIMELENNINTQFDKGIVEVVKNMIQEDIVI
jgi:diguanylate cyclase (GGDEF)-like protein/PAS domain S-box-containing protein